MEKRVVFTGQGQVELEEFSPSKPGRGQVAVRTLYSLMSTGTENIALNHWFDPGTHWDNWVKYPFRPGYLLIGEVAEVGEGVDKLKAGDRVGARVGHASWHVLSEAHCYPVPDAIESKEATWFGLGKIAFIGARAAGYSLGDTVLIIGAGPIGQMSVRWAAAAGAETIVVVDPWEKRMGPARRGGATHCIPGRVEDCHAEILEVVGGHLPRVVIDATGNSAVLPIALTLAANRGRVVILGDTGYPARQHLTADVISRGLTIIGAHDGHTDEQWNNSSIARLFFQLAQSGRIDLSHLITQEFAPEACADAYRLANTRREETLGILFDWTH